MTVFVANTNLLELLGLTDAVTGTVINDAAVTVTICDNNDKPVSGVSWPATLAYVAASAGNYRLVIDSAAGLVADTKHVAHINVNAGTNRIGHWDFAFTPTDRT